MCHSFDIAVQIGEILIESAGFSEQHSYTGNQDSLRDDIPANAGWAREIAADADGTFPTQYLSCP
jgi:hypothetical protein